MPKNDPSTNKRGSNEDVGVHVASANNRKAELSTCWPFDDEAVCAVEVTGEVEKRRPLLSSRRNVASKDNEGASRVVVKLV